MTCRINSDNDRCRTHRTPVEFMHFCEVDGPTCKLECPHPACHVVRSRRVQVPPFGARLIAYCSLCGEKSTKPGDAEDVSLWGTAHLKAVAK